MNMVKGWSQEAKRELDEACAEALAAGDTTRERTDAFVEIVRDAVQAHRQWAIEVERQMLHRGGSSFLKSWDKARNTVAVSLDGEVLSKTAKVGVLRVDAAGERAHQQVLFHHMTLGELREKREECVRNARSYEQSMMMYDRLIALVEAAPGTATPAAAAAQLGVTVEGWLGEQAAA